MQPAAAPADLNTPNVGGAADNGFDSGFLSTRLWNTLRESGLRGRLGLEMRVNNADGDAFYPQEIFEGIILKLCIPAEVFRYLPELNDGHVWFCVHFHRAARAARVRGTA